MMKNFIWTVAVMMGVSLVYSQHHPSSCDDEKLKDNFEKYGNCTGFNQLLMKNSHSDIKKSCGRSLKICSETLLAEVAACPGYFNFTKDITNTIDKVKDYVCSNGSSAIKTFLKEGGQNCIKNKKNEFASCVPKFMQYRGTNLKQMGTAGKVVKCLIEKLKICNKPELTKILEAIEAITNGTFYPSPLVKYNECIGYSHLLSIIFDKKYSENDIPKFCGNDVNICSKTLLMTLPSSPATLDIIDTAEKLTGYLCSDGGSIIKTFLREGGPNCLNDKAMEISLCKDSILQNETKSTYVTMKHDIDKVVTNCIAKQLKTCNNTELTKISQKFAEFTHFFHRVSQNKTRHNPNAANGITLSSGILLVTLIALLI